MSKRRNNKSILELALGLTMVICVTIYGYINSNIENESNNIQNANQSSSISNTEQSESTTFDLSTIPEYTSSPYVEINNNVPYFSKEDYTTTAFEKYSEWDSLGRSGVAYANICKETMPKDGEERGEIGSIKDLSGWVQKRYDNLIKDKYLYNRCHLIGWQLSAENANKQNLITGTRYLNIEGMLNFEDTVAEYVNTNTNNHVLYRVTPIFEGNNKLASGVEMEALSVEDEGRGICFNVYCYNVQPGIVIDYATGESHEE